MSNTYVPGWSLGAKLLRALGIDDTLVTRATLDMKADGVARLMIEQYLCESDGAAVEKVVTNYKLVEVSGDEED